jgi:methyltransferase (TIGR00027 family)
MPKIAWPRRSPEACAKYVILGAGLDTFAYRQPAWTRGLRIFEVDHPATQEWKRRRLSDALITIPENTTLVPVDLEKTTIKAALPTAGLDPTAPAFFSMLGVSQYLTEVSAGRNTGYSPGDRTIE